VRVVVLAGVVTPVAVVERSGVVSDEVIGVVVDPVVTYAAIDWFHTSFTSPRRHICFAFVARWRSLPDNLLTHTLFARTLTSPVAQALTGEVRSDRRTPVVRLMQTLFIVGETPLADTVCVHHKVKASAKRIARLLALLTFAD
jgi:hypothetical protein